MVITKALGPTRRAGEILAGFCLHGHSDGALQIAQNRREPRWRRIPIVGG